MDRGCNLAYQLAIAPSKEMMNDFASVPSSLHDEAIAARDT
jgi:hypothetical protein